MGNMHKNNQRKIKIMSPKKIKVNVSVVGRFHAFDLAFQLQKWDYLNKLITTYPKLITQRWGINKKNIISEIGLEIIRRYGHRLPLISGHRPAIDLPVFADLSVSCRLIQMNRGYGSCES